MTIKPEKTVEGWEKEFDSRWDFTILDSVIYEIMGENLERQMKKNIKDFIRRLLAKKEREKEELEKAYGGCHKCYGKGYATYREGYQGSPDFEGERESLPVMQTHMLFCSCDRGKQLKNLLRK